MGICGPAALTDLNNPIAGYRVILVPRADMSLPRNDDIRWNRQPQRTNALDHHCPDPTAWLEQLRSPAPVGIYNHELP